jgi:HEPN domain-containing protein
MIDIEKQVSFWREGAKEDFAVAWELMENGRVRHAFFFSHVALEKAIKAHVCRATRDLAPRIHNLVRLAQLAGISVSREQLDTLGKMNVYNIEGRYPDLSLPFITPEEAGGYMVRAQEVFEWLMSQL